MSIQSVFDKYASEYDSSRKKLIPCFDNFYQTAINEILFPKEQKIEVLDLESRTELMTGFVAASYPNANILLMDTAEKMLVLQILTAGLSTTVSSFLAGKKRGKYE